MRNALRSDGRITLTILGGFLGAGKSTWLRHQLYAKRFGRLHLIVNEAAQTPVDNLLLARADRVEVLAGGCACCEGKAALIATLRRICANRDAGASGTADRILLETSGLADPGAIAEAIAEDPLLVRRLVVDETIVLVDALNAPLQLVDDVLTRRQVEAAGTIVVSKPRGVPPDELARLVRTLRFLNPVADIEGAERGVPYELPDGTEAEAYVLPKLSVAQEPIRPLILDVSENGGWATFSVWLSALLAARGDDIVRVKGVVSTPAGRLLLQSVRRIVQPPEILPDHGNAPTPPPEDGRIVLLGRNMDEARILKSWERLR